MDAFRFTVPDCGGHPRRRRGHLGLIARAAILAAALFPAVARAQFCQVDPLFLGVVDTDTRTPWRYVFSPNTARWGAVAVRSTSDWGIGLFGASAPSPTCVTGQLETSTRYHDVDVVVGDFNHIALQPRYVVVARATGTTGYQIEWDQGDILPLNGHWMLRGLEADDVMDVWQVELTGGVEYHFDFSTPGGCRLLVFQNPASAAYYAGREDAIVDTQSSTVLVPTATDNYGVLVINTAGAGVSYRLRVVGCSENTVRDLSNDVAHEAVPSLTYWSFAPANAGWSAVALRDERSDWDLFVGRAFGTSSFPACNSEPLASSTGATHHTELVVGDFNVGANPLEEHFVTIYQEPSLVSSGSLKWKGDGERIVIGAPALERYTTTVMQVWDVEMTAGTQYTIDFSANGTDAEFYLFRNPGGPYWATRSDAVLTGTAATLYTAPSTGVYGLVVVEDEGEDGYYEAGVCAGTLPALTNGVVTPAVGTARYRFRQQRAYWAAAGIRSPASSVWNMELSRGACATGAALATSGTAGSGVHFVIGDFNHSPTGDYSVRATRVTGTSSAAVQWDGGGDQIVVNLPPVTRVTNAGHVLEVWDTFLTAGRTYSIYFARQGAANTKLLLFQSGGAASFGSRADALIETQDTYTEFTPAQSDYYGLVVVNDNGAGGSYALAVANAVTDAGADVTQAANALHRVSPNPSAGRIRVDFTLKDGGTARMDIVDVAGRIVASRPLPEVRPGASHVEWNGLDARGARVPAGIYWVRLSVGASVLGTRKFLVVR